MYGNYKQDTETGEIKCIGDNVNVFNKDTEITNKHYIYNGTESNSSNETFLKQIIIPTAQEYRMSYAERYGDANVNCTFFNNDTFIKTATYNSNGESIKIPERNN